MARERVLLRRAKLQAEEAQRRAADLRGGRHRSQARLPPR